MRSSAAGGWPVSWPPGPLRSEQARRRSSGTPSLSRCSGCRTTRPCPRAEPSGTEPHGRSPRQETETMSTVAQETGSITAPNGKLRRAESAEERWSRMPVIVDGGDYLASLRDRGTELYLLGERIEEPADHPIIKTSINSLRLTYDLAIQDRK